MVLLVLDGASNLLWTTTQSSRSNKGTIHAIRLWTDENNCMPEAVVDDEAFSQEDFLTDYRTQCIRECPGKSCSKALKMMGSKELPPEKLLNILFGPGALN